MTNSGTQQRTKLPEKAPVRNAARSLSNCRRRGSQQCEKDHQEAGGHAQQVYPADAFAGRGVRVGKSVLHLFVGVNRIFAKIRKKARRHDFFFAAVRRFLCRDARFAAPGAACRSVHDDRREIFAEKRCGTFRLFRGVLLRTPASLYSLPIASYLWTPSV